MTATRFLELVAWYGQFSSDLQPNLRADDNAFKPVEPARLKTLEDVSGLVLPEPYTTFLSEVGDGRFRVGENRVCLDSFNHFLSPANILERLDRSSAHWSIDPDLCDEGELPFFEYEMACYFVFDLSDHGSDAVWMPQGMLKIADSFQDFLERLKLDACFYNPIIDRYFDET